VNDAQKVSGTLFLILALFIAFALFKSFETIESGTVGVKITFGKYDDPSGAPL